MGLLISQSRGVYILICSKSLNHDSSLFSTSWSTIKGQIKIFHAMKDQTCKKIRQDSLIFSACYVTSMDFKVVRRGGRTDSAHVYIYPFCEMSDNSLKSNYRSGPAWKAPKLAATDGRAARNAFSKFDYDVVHVHEEAWRRAVHNWYEFARARSGLEKWSAEIQMPPLSWSCFYRGGTISSFPTNFYFFILEIFNGIEIES